MAPYNWRVVYPFIQSVTRGKRYWNGTPRDIRNRIQAESSRSLNSMAIKQGVNYDAPRLRFDLDEFRRVGSSDLAIKRFCVGGDAFCVDPVLAIELGLASRFAEDVLNTQSLKRGGAALGHDFGHG